MNATTHQVEYVTDVGFADVNGAISVSWRHSSSASKSTPEVHCCAVSVLCRAIVQRDVNLVKKHLSAFPRLASTMHILGFYPLSVAVLSGEPEIVRMILSQPGVNPEYETICFADNCDATLRSEFSSTYRTIYKANALHYACLSNNPEIIKLICQISGDFLVRDHYGRTPIEYIDSSTDEGFESLGIYFLAFDEWKRKGYLFGRVTREVLADAIFQKDFPLFEELLKRYPRVAGDDASDSSSSRGFDPFERYHWTPLHVAVMNQALPFVEQIIKVDASSVNVRSSELQNCQHFVSARCQPYDSIDGATALHIACLIGNFELADVLLKAGANCSIKDDSGRTPQDYVLNAHGEDQTNIFQKMCEEEDERRKAKKEPDLAATAKIDGDDTNHKSEEFSPKEVESKDEEPLAKALDLESVIGAKIIGQRGPVRSVASAIRLRENGWVDPDRPLVMLFLGSSGVGKTELAKQVALYIHGKDGTDLDAKEAITDLERKSKFVRIDMSEYQHDHTVSNLTGPPKGYVGYGEGGFLTTRLRKCPRAIVLLDEIEKAHPDVLTLFLQVFDDGRITDTEEGVIYCQNAVFIMTSNLASDEIKNTTPMLRRIIDSTENRPEEYLRIIGEFNRRIHPVLKQSLKRDEFLGRINRTIVFLPLNQEEIIVVVNNELTTWKKRAEEKHGIHLDWSMEVAKKLTKYYDVNFGVRSVVHEVQRIAIQLVADAQIRGVLKKSYLAYLSVDELGDIQLKGESREDRVRERKWCQYYTF